MRPIDPDQLKAYVLRVWQYKQGEMVSLMVHLGDRLGLYRALAGAGPVDPASLAEGVALDERWVEEWLLGQAAAGLVEREADGRYEMTPEAAEVLVNEGSLAFAAAAFAGGETPESIERIVDAFRTGRGHTYDAMGEELAGQIDRQNAAWLSTYLLERVLPELDGMMARLEKGAMVADIGCGGAVSTMALAKRFPASSFVGYEPSGSAARLAERRVADLDNVTIIEAKGEELAGDGPFDFVMTLDCMHDVPFPDRIATAIHDHLASDGAWLIKDMRSADRYEDMLRNPVLAMQYGYSLTGCLASATSEEGGAGLGTMGFTPAVAERITSAAGFTHIRTINLRDDPTHLYYEVRHEAPSTTISGVGDRP